MKAGDVFWWQGSNVRIMAIAEGYIMARRKGCYPFLVELKEVEERQRMRYRQTIGKREVKITDMKNGKYGFETDRDESGYVTAEDLGSAISEIELHFRHVDAR